jgi:hypothetical protein
MVSRCASNFLGHPDLRWRHNQQMLPVGSAPHDWGPRPAPQTGSKSVLPLGWTSKTTRDLSGFDLCQSMPSWGVNTRPIAEKVEKTDIETLQLFHLDRTNEFGLMVSEWLSSKDPPECSFIQLPIRHG